MPSNALTRQPVHVLCGLIATFPFLGECGRAEVPSAAAEIRTEATIDSSGKTGYALPLAASWNTGFFHYSGPDRARGFDPAYQLEQIEKGHHVLPTFALPLADFDEHRYGPYLYPPFEKVRDKKLPFTLLGSQWERYLTDNPEYFNLPAETNPNVVTPKGEILRMVDPFGPTQHWYDLGKKLTNNPNLNRLQEIYPDPPLVIFLSNNEHAKLGWEDAEKSRRYLEKFGKGRNGDFKRKVFGDAWIEKYRALQAGMRDGLASPQWKEKSIFIAYGGDVSFSIMGRWDGWPKYSLHSAGRVSPVPWMWDGLSPSYYQHPWSEITDHTIYSPQIELMNTVFVIRQFYEVNPRFWYELSVWDGDQANPAKKIPSKVQGYRDAGQTYDNARYEGYLQYGLWLTRPRVLREFRNWTDALADREEAFEAVMAAVDRVYAQPALQRYWRDGELLPNPRGRHPYQAALPPEIAAQERWFLPDINVNPKPPFSLGTEIPVFALVYQLGQSPKRSWLLYAYSPLQAREEVEITIPGWSAVKVNVPRAGAFYEIQEDGGGTRLVYPEKL